MLIDAESDRKSGRVEFSVTKREFKSPLKIDGRNVKFEKFKEIEAKQSFCNLMPSCPPIQKYRGGKYII